MAHYKAISKKSLVVAVVLVVVMVLATGFISYKIGYRQSTKDGQEPMENEIRLVQENTATQVVDMFMNIKEVREAMNSTQGNIYSCRINWWNFDRQFELTRFKENNYHEQWWDLAR